MEQIWHMSIATNRIVFPGDQLMCPVGQVALYRSPKTQSEMVSEILFGETVTVLEQKDKWCYVRCNWDDCEVWVKLCQLTKIDRTLDDLSFSYSYAWSQVIEPKKGRVLVPMGSPLMSFDGLTFKWEKEKVNFQSPAINPVDNFPSDEKIIKITHKYLNVPHRSGGRTPFGIDAAAFLQMIFRFFDIHLPRNVRAQSKCGQSVSFIDLADVGDIAFFSDKSDKMYLSHVGIVLGDNRIIHVQEKVRIDLVDHNGIFNEEEKKYTYFLRGVRRLID